MSDSGDEAHEDEEDEKQQKKRVRKVKNPEERAYNYAAQDFDASFYNMLSFYLAFLPEKDQILSNIYSLITSLKLSDAKKADLYYELLSEVSIAYAKERDIQPPVQAQIQPQVQPPVQPQSMRMSGVINQILSDLSVGNIFWKKYRKEKLVEEKQNLVVEEGIFTCSKCFSKRIHSEQIQIRSADEGATTFLKCTQCGHQWRNNN